MDYETSFYMAFEKTSSKSNNIDMRFLGSLQLRARSILTPPPPPKSSKTLLWSTDVWINDFYLLQRENTRKWFASDSFKVFINYIKDMRIHNNYSIHWGSRFMIFLQN